MSGRQWPFQPTEEVRMERVRDDGRDDKRADYDEEACPQLIQMRQASPPRSAQAGAAADSWRG